MNNKTKKYPLLVSLIVSCVIVVASIFILGFFGMKLGTTLGGGSQFEIVLANDADQKKTIEEVKKSVSDCGFRVDSVYVEDSYIAGEENATYTERVLIVKIADSEISEEKALKIQKKVAKELKIDISKISAVEDITSVVRAKDVLFLALALGIIAVCVFVFGIFRYDVFAGLSFLFAYIHNIILYLSILILTRVQLNIISLGVAIVLTLAMSGLLVQIYEKYRADSKVQDSDKLTVSERMILAEKSSVKPYLFVAVAILAFALLLLLVPTARVRFASIGMVIALAVTLYTGLLVAPGVYASLAEIRENNQKAVLSRNDTVNKAIKKKIKKSAKEAAKK